MSEQDDLNKITKAAQDTNNHRFIQWVSVLLMSAAGIGSVPFLGAHELPIVIVLLSVSLPVWSVIFHRKGLAAAVPIIATQYVPVPTTATYGGSTVVNSPTMPAGLWYQSQAKVKAAETAFGKPPTTVRNPIVSDKLDTLYTPKPEQAIPPKTIAELVNLIPKTLLNHSLEEPPMVELHSNEAKLLSLLASAGNANGGALVSAMAAKGKKPEDLMAQAATLLVSKYPQLNAYAGAEATLAAEMVKGAGSTEQAVMLANDLIMAETFGPIPATPTPVVHAPTPVEPAKAYDEEIVNAEPAPPTSL